MKLTFFTKAKHYLLLGLSTMTVGCTPPTLHLDFAYQRAEKIYDWGTLHTALLGRDKIIDSSNSVRGKPYNLLVWGTLSQALSKESVESCSIDIESIKLVNLSNQKIAFAASNLKAGFKPESKYNFVSTFDFDGLDISYDDYLLDITFTLRTGCGNSHIERLQLLLKKDYKEKKITIWDQLTG
jgi:hypothetical protein